MESYGGDTSMSPRRSYRRRRDRAQASASFKRNTIPNAQYREPGACSAYQ